MLRPGAAGAGKSSVLGKETRLTKALVVAGEASVRKRTARLKRATRRADAVQVQNLEGAKDKRGSGPGSMLPAATDSGRRLSLEAVSNKQEGKSQQQRKLKLGPAYRRGNP